MMSCFPYVKHVHLRDTGRAQGKFQVRVGQGEIEYGRIINQLERQNYDRLLSVHFRMCRCALHDGNRSAQAQIPARKPCVITPNPPHLRRGDPLHIFEPFDCVRDRQAERRLLPSATAPIR